MVAAIVNSLIIGIFYFVLVGMLLTLIFTLYKLDIKFEVLYCAAITAENPKDTELTEEEVKLIVKDKRQEKDQGIKEALLDLFRRHKYW